MWNNGGILISTSTRTKQTIKFSNDFRAPSTPGRYYFHGHFLGNRLLKGLGKNGDVRRVGAMIPRIKISSKKREKISPGAEGGFQR